MGAEDIRTTNCHPTYLLCCVVSCYVCVLSRAQELLFSIMNQPLSALLPSSGPKGINNDDVHTLVGLKQSLASLGPHSFLPGKSASIAMPETPGMDEQMKSITKLAPSAAGSTVTIYCCGHVLSPSQQCPACGRYYCNTCRKIQNFHVAPGDSLACSACAGSHRHTGQSNILKDNSKFIVTDSLRVMESSSIVAMELLKENEIDIRGIKTSTHKLTVEIVKELILCSMLGSKKVLTEIFPDAVGIAPSVASDASFEAVDS